MGVHPMLEKERDAYRNLRGKGWKNPGPNNKYTKFGQLSMGKIICTDCHQMSHFKAKMHQIRFFVSVCLSVSARTIGWTDVSVCHIERHVAPRAAYYYRIGAECYRRSRRTAYAAIEARAYRLWPEAIQSYAALFCRIMVSTLVIRGLLFICRPRMDGKMSWFIWLAHSWQFILDRTQIRESPPTEDLHPNTKPRS